MTKCCLNKSFLALIEDRKKENENDDIGESNVQQNLGDEIPGLLFEEALLMLSPCGC